MSIEQWREALAESFPSSEVGRPYDLAAAIYAAYDEGRIPAQNIRLASSKQGERTYLGASQVGEPCARKLWADWRGGGDPPDGRLRRLFATGYAVEARVITELRAIGFDHAPDYRGFSAYGDRVRGHCDGFIRLGDLSAIVEIKSCNKKRFAALEKTREAGEDSEGGEYDLAAWDPKYNGQVHSYLSAHGHDVALYVVSCKDDDRIAAWVIEYDPAVAREAARRARAVLAAIDEAPPRGYPRPVQPACSVWCAHGDWCWYGGEVPRACWSCRHWRQGGVCDLTGERAEGVCVEYDGVSVPGTQLTWGDM